MNSRPHLILMLVISIAAPVTSGFPQVRDKYDRKTLQLIQERKYREAVDKLIKEIGSDTEKAKTYATFSVLYRELQECSLAWKYYEIAKDLKFDDPDLLESLSKLCKEPKDEEYKENDLPVRESNGKKDAAGTHLWLPFPPEQSEWPKRAKLRLFPSYMYWELTIVQVRKVRELTGVTVPWVVISPKQTFKVNIHTNLTDGWQMVLVPVGAPFTRP